MVRDEGQFSSWDAVQLDDFDLLGYDPHAALKVEVN
jgi:thymidylate synthase